MALFPSRLALPKSVPCQHSRKHFVGTNPHVQVLTCANPKCKMPLMTCCLQEITLPEWELVAEQLLTTLNAAGMKSGSNKISHHVAREGNAQSGLADQNSRGDSMTHYGGVEEKVVLWHIRARAP